MAKETYSKPSDVVASEGRVLVDGPGNLDLAFTPGAATVTGERLIEEAAKAAEQGREEGPPGDAGPPGQADLPKD